MNYFLIANLKLYFNKFEEELAPEIPEPSNKAYDMAQQGQDAQTTVPSDSDTLELDI